MAFDYQRYMTTTNRSMNKQGSNTTADEGMLGSASGGVFGTGANVSLAKEWSNIFSPSEQTTTSSQVTTTDTYSPTSTYSPAYSFVYGSGTSSASGANVNPSTSTKVGASQSTSPSLVSKPSTAQGIDQAQGQSMSSPLESIMIIAVIGVGGFLLIKSGALKKLGGKKK